MSDKTYFVEKENGEEFQITVPEEWKVTFGPAVVGSGQKRPGDFSGKMPMALRFYESKDKQRAIFTHIRSFRDMSIPIKVKKTHVQEKQGFMEYEGKRKATSFSAKVQEWVNPDEVLEQKAIPNVKDFDVEFMDE